MGWRARLDRLRGPASAKLDRKEARPIGVGYYERRLLLSLN
jgi:hypothetical protein